MEENQLELADEIAEKQRSTGIDMIRQRLAEQTHPDFDGENCVECGDTMPALRLQLKRIRCTGCETALEKRKKMFGTSTD